MSKEEQMRALFDEWRASGKPRTTFARERQVPINTFHYWCQRFEGKRYRARSGEAEKPATPSFVPVDAAPAPPSALQPPAAGQPRMRFELADGTVVILRCLSVQTA
ncbi:MAG TPA: hypothetical protein VNA88_04260 [Candidatus Kapabacteria bacterium]|nr:hypothetical protein [Candidatus Kapabacteria bacterium]HVK37722.1 hypothetical protein [Candidatus Kapabacteria bacterium]